MLVNFTQTKNFNGVSAVDVVEGKGEPVMYMNGAIDASGNVSFSEQIRNIDLFKKHREEVEKDQAEFKKRVLDEAIKE
jgi:hypothetical protein